MSCTSTTKCSSDVSDSDSCETDYPNRKHPYNTRYSNKNCPVKQQSSKSTKGSKCVPNYSYRKSKEKQNFQEQDDDSSMDYCFDDNCLPTPRWDKKSILCCFLRIAFFLVLFGGICFTIYSQYLLNIEIKKLKEEVHKKGRQKTEDLKAKTLGKKCMESLKALVQDAVCRPDFALESSGGRVVSVNAIPFSNPKTFLGFNLCEGDYGPSWMIKATTSPGECWAFKGQTGNAVIRLIDDVLVDAVTLEHIPSNISPSGSIDTAPKDFKLWGMDGIRGKRRLLGQFKYASEGDPIQTFEIKDDVDYHYRFVEFEVMSNHGNNDFTCVYRLRVHGSVKK